MTADRRCAIAILFALGLTSAPAGAAQDGVPVLFDRTLTVGAGATVTTAVAAAIARGEDAIVPARLFSERGVARRAANIAYRINKLLFFDLPQEQWLLVVNHEVMGHGARLRERFDGSIHYTIDPPAPYGDGGGTTFFRFDREPTGHELMAVAAAGMEADAVAARLVASRAFSRSRMRFRDAIRYLGFELDTLNYVSSTGDALDEERAGHDVAQFLQTYNAIAEAAAVPSVTPRTLRREALVSLANPMLGFAAFGIGRYLWSGAADVPVPAVSIAGVRWLPLVRYQLTPYGTEAAVTNHLDGGRWPTRIEVRVGRAPGARPWGVGVERRALSTWRSWRLDAGVEIWRQPRIAEATTSAARDTRLGIEVRGRAERALLPVWFSSGRAAAIVEIGLKTAGFVPGQPLGRGVMARVGIGLPFD
jgi:hypothetical protein